MGGDKVRYPRCMAIFIRDVHVWPDGFAARCARRAVHASVVPQRQPSHIHHFVPPRTHFVVLEQYWHTKRVPTTGGSQTHAKGPLRSWSDRKPRRTTCRAASSDDVPCDVVLRRPAILKSHTAARDGQTSLIRTNDARVDEMILQLWPTQDVDLRRQAVPLR